MTAIPASAVEATLVADAHVSAARPNANSGTLSNLNVGGGYTALLQFDLGSLPDGTIAAQISRAALRLYCNRADTPGTLSVQAINSPWGEYSVTYTNLPGMAASSGILSVNQEGTYISVDVTNMVRGWVTAPSSNNGIALTSTAAIVQFDSKENDLTGHAPVLDITLVSQGSAGPKGDAGAPGAQGIPGPIGPAGPAGMQGTKGDSGPAGAPGPQGAAGATGPQGPAGLAGPAGPQGIKGDLGSVGPAGPEGTAGKPGLAYRGTYQPTFSYSLGDVVSWQGTGFVSLTDGNYNNAPDAGAPWWGVLADRGAAGTQGQVGVQGPVGPQGPAGPSGSAGLQGSQGPTGPSGPPGSVGATGPQGPAGPTGATGAIGPQGPAGQAGATGPQGSPGPVGMTFQGNYSPSTPYAAGDGVSFDGAGYVSLINGNLGQAPDQSPDAWGRFAAGSQGIQGVAGPQGSQGPIGPSGPAGVVGATGLQGPQGPAGVPGPAGLQGPQGVAGVSFRGAWSSVESYVQNDAVFFEGSTYLALATSKGANPDVTPAAWAILAQSGAAGPTGPAGEPATVSIGTVTTGAPGTPATVVNSGTAAAAVLNFTIPQGAAGTNGSGSVGSSNSALSMYHSVSFSTHFYSVSNTNASATETASILTWIPSGCAATSLTAYSQQVNTITVKMRMGTPGSMSDTELSCSVSTGSTCTSTASVPVPAGSFIDLDIEGPNGQQAGVWTALACN